MLDDQRTPSYARGLKALVLKQTRSLKNIRNSSDVAIPVMRTNLYPKAPDMRLANTQKLTDGELYTPLRTAFG
jgi:hypothetical protein